MKDIYARTPINKTAGLAVSGGIHWNPKRKDKTQVCSDTPLPIKEPQKQPGFIDFTFSRKGMLTVIGPSADRKGMWVCRCHCGNYVLRRTKSLKNESNKGDRCDPCQSLAEIKRKEYWRRTGKDCQWSDF